jgi:small neutral amino acid transporter SnatA (MarC family)
MIPSIIFSILFIVLAIILLMGKGDRLIAGYNTASEEERKKIDIRRLRIVIAVLMVMTAVFCIVLPLLCNSVSSQLLAAGIFCAITVVDVIVANTWARKK